MSPMKVNEFSATLSCHHFNSLCFQSFTSFSLLNNYDRSFSMSSMRLFISLTMPSTIHFADSALDLSPILMSNDSAENVSTFIALPSQGGLLLSYYYYALVITGKGPGEFIPKAS